MSSDRNKHKSEEAHYRLEEVQELVRNDRVLIRENALESALEDFGWEMDDILDAMLKLKDSHFYKTEPLRFNPATKMDYYKANNLNGEDVYMHFYIDDDQVVLVLSSFKQL